MTSVRDRVGGVLIGLAAGDRIGGPLRMALGSAIAFAGPSNSCPVLGGSPGGARWGRSGIDPALYAHHGDLTARIRRAAAGLADAW